MSAVLERKPRSRVITGWRHAVPTGKVRKRKVPAVPVPPEKATKGSL